MDIEQVLNKKQEEVYKLKKIINKYQQKQTQLQTMYNTLLAQNASLKSQIHKLQLLQNIQTQFTPKSSPSAQNTFLQNKIDQIILINNQYKSQNIHLVELIKSHSTQIIQLQSKLQILQQQIQMHQIQKIQRQAVIKLCSDIQLHNKKLLEINTNLTRQNGKLRKQQANNMNKFLEYVENLKDIQKQIAEKGKQTNYQNQISIQKDKKIKSLQQDLKQLKQTINQKNEILARLDRDIYKLAQKKQSQIKLRQLTFSSDQQVSRMNTIYFISNELKKRADLFRNLREKYTLLICAQQNITINMSKLQGSIKQKDHLIQQLREQISKCREQMRYLQKCREGWQKKYNDQYELRRQIDITLQDILYQNEALNYIIFIKNLQHQNLKNQIKLKKQQLKLQYKAESQDYPQYKFTTVPELIKKNRQLIQILKNKF